MKTEINEIVIKLNKLHQLYTIAIQTAKPYRISRIRNLYLSLLKETESQFPIFTLTSEKYSVIVGNNEKLNSIVSKKLQAVANHDYELGARLRDNEKIVLRLLLEEMGVQKDSIYFVWENTVVKVL